MKRLLFAAACLVFGPSVQASPDLASDWGIKAAELHTVTTNMMGSLDQGAGADVTDTYITEVERFSLNAARLAVWVDKSNGAADLGCIFRGMAEEGDVQIMALVASSRASQTDQREALRRLASLFADAEMIAIASQRRAELPLSPMAKVNASEKASCPASTAAALAALR